MKDTVKLEDLPTRLNPPQYSPSHVPLDCSSHEAHVLPENIKLKVTTSGVSSNDPSLNSDAALLSLFFHSKNTRPSMEIYIKGYEMIEIREKIITRNANGHSHVSHRTRHEKKSHFKFSYDVSCYIKPAGGILVSSDGTPDQVEAILAEHVSDTNRLKKIVLEKKVLWDYDWLTQALISAIRSRGFSQQIEVDYRLENHRLKVTCDSSRSRFIDHPVTKVLCVITCLCVIAWPIAYFYRRDHKRKLYSTFSMNVTPQDWYNEAYTSLMNANLYNCLQ